MLTDHQKDALTVIRFLNSRVAVCSVSQREEAAQAAERLNAAKVGVTELVNLYVEVIRKSS